MFEDYLAEINKPIKAIDTLLDMIIYDASEDGIYSGEYGREYAEKHMALLFCLQLIAKYMIKQRKIYYRQMSIENYRK